MRVLLDECLPRRLKRDLEGHEVRTVPEMGWAGIKNGALLRRAAEQFDVFLSSDHNIKFQQNLATVRIGIIVMHATSNDISVLRPLMPAVLEALPSARPGEVVHVGKGPI